MVPGQSSSQGTAVQWAELGRRQAAAGGIAGRSRAGPGREEARAPLAGIRLGSESARFTPGSVRQTPPGRAPGRAAVLRARRGRCCQRSFPGSKRAGSHRESYFRRRAAGAAVDPAGEGLGPEQARPVPRPLIAPSRCPSLASPCRARGRRDAVPARLPEDHLRVPAAGGCDSELPGDPGPGAAGAPGRVTRSLSAGRDRSDLAVFTFNCHYQRGRKRGICVPTVQIRDRAGPESRGLECEPPRAGGAGRLHRVHGPLESGRRRGLRLSAHPVATTPGVAKEQGGIYGGLNFSPQCQNELSAAELALYTDRNRSLGEPAGKGSASASFRVMSGRQTRPLAFLMLTARGERLTVMEST